MDLVVNNGSPSKNKCTIVVDGEGTTYTEFVAFGSDPKTHHVKMNFVADAYTLGIAAKMINEAFQQSFSELPVDVQKDLAKELGIIR